MFKRKGSKSRASAKSKKSGKKAKKEKASTKDKKKDRDNKKRKKKVAAIESLSGESSSDASEEEDDSSSTDTCESNISAPAPAKPIPQALRVPDKKILPGASKTPAPVPSWYPKRILQEERPDLTGDGSIEMDATELDLLDHYVRERAELQVEDLIVNDDNFDDDDRRFIRYEIQLKYNEGRYSAIYIVSKQICKEGVVKDASGLYALKTGLRNGSSTFSIKMKRELRILASMTKAKATWAPTFFDSGSVGDMPFIVMGLLDMNIDKLREMLGGKFKPCSAFYISGEVLNGLHELHSRGFVHRDIKPMNICVGVGALSARVYIIDYGDTVRRGKKIKYSTPDAHTLPYWSIESHRRIAATEKNDIEGWFYTTTDLLSPAVLTWKGELSEPNVEKAKVEFWGDFQSHMSRCPPALISIAEAIHSAGEKKVDVSKLKRFVRVGLEQSATPGKKFAPEWVRGGTMATAVGMQHSAKSRTPRETAAT